MEELAQRVADRSPPSNAHFDGVGLRHVQDFVGERFDFVA